MPENSQSHSNSFLKTTILNLYQTSMHYWHGSSPDETNTTSQGGQETVGGGDKSANRAQTPQPEISRRRISRRNKENSDKYFIVLFWLLVCAKLRYDLFILVPFVVIVWKVAKHALRLVLDLIGSSGKCELVKEWFVRRREILAPRVVRLLVKFFRKGDHKCIQVISHSMDTIVTGLIMVALFLAIVCSAIILCIQVGVLNSSILTFLSLLIFNFSLFNIKKGAIRNDTTDVIRQRNPKRTALLQTGMASMAAREGTPKQALPHNDQKLPPSRPRMALTQPQKHRPKPEPQQQQLGLYPPRGSDTRTMGQSIRIFEPTSHVFHIY